MGKSSKELVAVNKAVLFSAKTKLPSEFKRDITDQLNQLFDDPSRINNVAINEFTSISSGHLVGQQGYQKRLDSRVKQLITNSDEELVSGLAQLRTAAESIMPVSKIKTLQPGGLGNKCLKFIGYNYDKKKITKAVTRFDGAQATIEKFCESLAGAKEVIVEDLGVLLEVGDDLASSQFNVSRDIFFMEKLLEKLESGVDIPGVADDSKESLVLSLRQDLLDLKALEQVNAQYLTTIEQTCMSARMRVKSVERACGLTGKTASIGLLLKGVMENNKRITNAIDASRDFISAQLVNNAEMFSGQVADLERTASQTFVDIAELQKAYSTIHDALEKSAGGLGRANESLKIALAQMDTIQLPEKTTRIDSEASHTVVGYTPNRTEVETPMTLPSAKNEFGFLKALTKEVANKRGNDGK